MTRRMPYRPFTSFLPYDLKDANVKNSPNGNGYFDPLNDKLDLEWGGTRTDEAFNSYYDYFFSGEDIKIFIDGLFDPVDEMDIASMAYVVKQEKQPLYGFWSYNYDAMMYGTRLITGEFSLYSRYPRRMTQLLEKASSVRSQSSSANPSSSVISRLNSNNENQNDEININKYWTSSQLDRISTGPNTTSTLQSYEDQGHNIFSAHPPFNLIIFYGLEEAGVSTNPSVAYKNGSEINQQLNSDRILATDYNERSTITSTNSPMKIVLQNVQLVSMSTSYQSGGQPLIENYQFIARDFYFADETRGSAPFKDTAATVPNSGTVSSQNVNTENPKVTVTDGINLTGIQGLGTV
jgi:hypothetical protein